MDRDLLFGDIDWPCFWTPTMTSIEASELTGDQVDVDQRLRPQPGHGRRADVLDREHALPQRGEDPVARGDVPLRPRRVGGDDLDRRRHPHAQLDPSGVDVLLGRRLERAPERVSTHALGQVPT